jgi:hypothetical protein
MGATQENAASATGAVAVAEEASSTNQRTESLKGWSVTHTTFSAVY